MSNEIEVIHRETQQLQPLEVLEQVTSIQTLMKLAMKKDVHFGTIPGTQKPTLYKDGAEKLSLMFRLAPMYDIEKIDLGDGHREYEISCSLKHILTGNFFGQGVGSCSSMESKFRWRNAQRICPECKQETIIKGKEEYGGGWLCYRKKGGCGEKFDSEDKRLTDQAIGKVENPDIADIYNTVKKMAKKRAFVDAMLTATAASDIFSQDIEDLKDNAANSIQDAIDPDSIQKDISNLNYDDLNFSHEEYFKKAKTADEVKDLFYKLPSNDQKEGTTAYMEAVARNEVIKKAS